MLCAEGHVACGASFVAGVVFHLLVFRVGEWDLWAMRLVCSLLATEAAATTAMVHWLPEPYQALSSAVSDVIRLASFLILGLTTSMLVYRAFFHRLRYSCIGKHLGLMQIRRLMAAIVHRYDLTLEKGQTAEEFVDGAMDMFSLFAAPLKVDFAVRKGRE